MRLSHHGYDVRVPLESRSELGLLLRVAHRRAAREANEALAPLGIEGRHLGVLHLLEARGRLSQTQLVEALGADKSGMVRTVDDLERIGAAVRQPDPGDRRARLVELTGPGRELLRSAQTAAEGVAGRLFGSIPAADYEVVRRVLAEIAALPPRN
jgi:DNA-binding MarR family transcriptional regulator